VELFSRRADEAARGDTPSAGAALEALPLAGSVLDVGCGAGAATMPLLARARRAIGVDPSAEMLAEFTSRVRAAGKEVETLQGTWDVVAQRAPLADVVVCHHVVYNVPHLDHFVIELTRHARRRVVMELSARHPLSWLNELWMRFHGLQRPSEPTAETAAQVVREAGFMPHEARWPTDLPAHEHFEDFVASVRRRLCLPSERDPQIAAALAELPNLPPRELVALWWDGTADASG
jgi:SAM-dependent methyltransferase